jgi:hypothetical protein
MFANATASDKALRVALDVARAAKANERKRTYYGAECCGSLRSTVLVDSPVPAL